MLSFKLKTGCFFNYVILILFFAVFIRIICAYGLAAVNDKDTRLIVLNLKDIDIIYYHDFSSEAVEVSENNRDCFYPWFHSEIVRCKERAQLLRSADVVNKWWLQQSRQGYFLFTDSDIGIKAEHAYIIRVHNFSHKESSDEYLADRVTGKIIRHALNVETYTFLNLKTGAISTINATANHRFYVLNRQAFIPVSKIIPADRLINKAGERLRLLCSKRMGKHGVSDSKKRLLSVHNLEVYSRHTYFAGKNRVLVHNGCFDDYSDNHLKDESAEYAANFVNRQVRTYVPYHLKKLFMDFKDADPSIRDRILALWQKKPSDNLSREQFMIDFATESGTGSSLYMCLVGEKVLHSYGFNQPVRILCFQNHYFLEMGYGYSDRWIADPLMERHFPKNQIYELLVFYAYEMAEDLDELFSLTQRSIAVMAYKDFVPMLIRENAAIRESATKRALHEVGFEVHKSSWQVM